MGAKTHVNERVAVGEVHRHASVAQARIRSRPSTFRTFKSGGEGQNRTADTTIFSRMLYQLSYLARLVSRLPASVSTRGQEAKIIARPWGLNRCGLCFAREPELSANAILDRLVDVGIVLEELLGVLATLAEALAAVREPGTALFDDTFFNGQVQ